MQQTEQPIRFLSEIARVSMDNCATMVAEGIEDHEERMHIPPRRRDPLTAIPFAQIRLDDVTVAKAIEMLRNSQDPSVDVVARMLDVPVEALELALAEYKPRWRRFLMSRMAG
mgnify:CR=1 FL=1